MVKVRVARVSQSEVTHVRPITTTPVTEGHPSRSRNETRCSPTFRCCGLFSRAGQCAKSRSFRSLTLRLGKASDVINPSQSWALLAALIVIATAANWADQAIAADERKQSRLTRLFVAGWP
jgi:hypothetical protein